MIDLIAIIGPTASGKTALAAHLAARMGTDVVSADSRQVYRRMDLGTGKDLGDYLVGDYRVPCHLIDIAEPGTHYNLFNYQKDFVEVYNRLRAQGKLPIVCGGSGLYVESVLRGYQLADVPENPELRRSLEGKTLDELTEILKSYRTLHNSTDTDTAKRAIRAIEIEDYCARLSPEARTADFFPRLSSLVIGLSISRELRRERISARLRQRLDQGMADEVRGLLAEGLAPEQLIYYGLEYKFLTLYVTGQLSYAEMLERLETAIHQFAKRQMTWFRGMERRGITVRWVDATLPMNEKIDQIMKLYEETR